MEKQLYTEADFESWDQRTTMLPPPYKGEMARNLSGIHIGDEWVDSMSASYLACHGKKSELPHMDEPCWVDWQRIERGQKLCEFHLARSFSALGLMLLAGFSIRRFAEVLFRNGYAQDGETAMKRYQATGYAVIDWFTEPLNGENSRGKKSIYTVRAMHGLARRNTRKFFKEEEGVPLSQYDMAEVLLGFSGIVLIIQEDLGFDKVPDQDLADMVFLWRYIGYHLGVTDEFNVCESVERMSSCVADYMLFTPRRFATLHECSHELRRTAVEGFSLQTGLGVQYWKGAYSLIFNRPEVQHYKIGNLESKGLDVIPGMEELCQVYFKLFNFEFVSSRTRTNLHLLRQMQLSNPEKHEALLKVLKRVSTFHDLVVWRLYSGMFRVRKIISFLVGCLLSVKILSKLKSSILIKSISNF